MASIKSFFVSDSIFTKKIRSFYSEISTIPYVVYSLYTVLSAKLAVPTKKQTHFGIGDKIWKRGEVIDLRGLIEGHLMDPIVTPVNT